MVIGLRGLLVLMHRWFGLGAAAFLFVAGLTGAVIAWDHELDTWLNPQLFDAPPRTPLLSADQLAARLQASEPRLRITYYELTPRVGHAHLFSVEPRIDPKTGEPFNLDFNQIALDPATGAVLGKREWGKVSLSRENLLPFLYKLHYSMHIPSGWGIDLGVMLMGVIAMAWVIDSMVALYLAFPNPAAWLRSFAFRWRAGGYRLVFDLHRSGGVWLFPLVLMLAITSVSMNMEAQVMRPLVSLFSRLSPSPFAQRQPSARPIEPRLNVAQILARSTEESRRLQLTTPPQGVYLSTRFGVYGVGLFAPGNSHGDGGLGTTWLYFDAQNGALLGPVIPGHGSAGDLFMQAMFPLHSGRIIGTAGRLLISLTGLAIALFCVTGVVIWAKKRRARMLKRAGGTAYPQRG